MMKIIVVGSGPAGLSAAYSLSNEGHPVILVEGQNRFYPSMLNTIDVSILERKGLLADRVRREAPIKEPVRNHQYSFGNNITSFGGPFSLPVSNTLFTTEECNFYDWLLDVLRKKGVNIILEQPARKLVRRNGRVVGVHGEFGTLRSEVVFLAESAPGTLTRDGGYRRTLPGEPADYLVSLRESVSYPGGKLLDRFGLPHLETPLKWTMFITTSVRDKLMNGTIHLTSSSRQTVLQLKLPLKQFQKVGISPSEWIGWLRSLPVFPEDFGTATSLKCHVTTRRAGGRSRWSTLCDHGLGIGGECAGLEFHLPAPGPDPKFYSGYQFARAVSHLENQSVRPTRENLKALYKNPLESQLGTQALQEDVWSNLLLSGELCPERSSTAVRQSSTCSFTQKGVNHEGAERTQKSNLGAFCRNVFDQMPSGFFSLSEATKLLKSMDFQLSRDSLLSRGNVALEVLYGLIKYLLSKPFSNRGNSFPDVLSDKLLNRALRDLLQEAFSRDTSRENKLNAVETVAWLLNMAVQRDVTAHVTSPCSPGVTMPSSDVEFDDDSEKTVTIQTPVRGSINLEPERLERLDTICPTNVYDFEKENLRVREDRCVRCGICETGVCRQAVNTVGGISSEEFTLPEPFQCDPSSRYEFESFPSSVRSKLQSHRRRLNQERKTLNRTLVSPGTLNWIQGQVNYFKTNLEEISEEDGVSDTYVDDLLSLVEDLRISLAGRNLTSVRGSVSLLVNFYLQPFHDNTARIRKEDETEISRRKQKNNGPFKIRSINKGSKCEDTKYQDYYPNIYNDISFLSLAEKTLRRLNLQLVQRAENRGLNLIGSRKNPLSIGFLDSVSEPQVTVFQDDETQHIVPAGHEDTILEVSNLSIQREISFRNSVVRCYSGEGIISRLQSPVTSTSRDIKPYLTEIIRSYVHLVKGVVKRSRHPENEGNDGMLQGDFDGSSVYPSDYSGFRVNVDSSLSLLHQLRDQNAGKMSYLAGLTNLVETLAYGEEALLEPGQFFQGQETVSGAELKTLRSLIKTYPIPWPALTDALLRDFDPAPNGSDFVSLSESEETLWTKSDWTGMVDHRIRQWRSEVSKLRGRVTNDRITPRQTGRLLSRLWRSRLMISGLIKRLLDGTAKRREKLVLENFMKQSFRISRRVSNPELRSDKLSCGAGTSLDPDVIREYITVFDPTVLNQAISEVTKGAEENFSRRIYDSLDPDKLHTQDTRFQLAGRLANLSSRVLSSGQNKNAETTETCLRDLSIEGALFDLLDFLETHRQTERWSCLKSIILQRRKNRRRYVRQSSFRSGLKWLSDKRTDRLSYLQEGDLRKQVEESLHSFLDLSETLTTKLSLFPLYSVYLELVAELKNKPVLENGTDVPESVEEFVRRRNIGTLESTSSLFNHGVNRLRSGVKPPESQLLDLDYPTYLLR